MPQQFEKLIKMWRSFPLPASVLAGFLLGCGAEATPTPSTDAGDAGKDASEASTAPCGIVGAQDACSNCLIDNCCEESAYCAGNDACSGLGACVDACGGDVACVSSCKQTFPGGVAPRQAILDCTAYACSEVCGVTASRCGTSSNSGECADCIVQNCCEQSEDCAADPQCHLVGTCLSQCEDEACRVACRQGEPVGYATWAAWHACESFHCSTPCQIPADERCGGPLEDDACHACAVTECCGAMSAAQSDGVALQLCADACLDGDDACIEECALTNQEGFVSTKVFGNCLFTRCGSSCEDMLGQSYPCGEIHALLSEECRACVDQNLCEEFTNWSMSPALWRYSICVGACGTNDACRAACCADHLEGCAISNTTPNAIGQRCYDPCDSEFGALSSCGTWSWSSCDSCVTENCCEENLAISGQEGSAYLLCDMFCTTPACSAQCVLAYPDGAVYYDLVADCVMERCSECGYTSKECGLRYDDITPCADCLVEHCCEENSACAHDFDCARIDFCRHLEGCQADDQACLDLCRQANPEGVTLFDAIMTCRGNACGTACEES